MLYRAGCVLCDSLPLFSLKGLGFPEWARTGFIKADGWNQLLEEKDETEFLTLELEVQEGKTIEFARKIWRLQK